MLYESVHSSWILFFSLDTKLKLQYHSHPQKLVKKDYLDSDYARKPTDLSIKRKKEEKKKSSLSLSERCVLTEGSSDFLFFALENLSFSACG